MSTRHEIVTRGRELAGKALAALSPRVAALACAGLLALVFIFPLWRIELYAPQYPEGLTMYIWVNKLAGEVDQVNLLNHYVGMRKIDALSIPELVFMPKVVLGLIAAALVAAVFNRRWSIASWYAAFVALGTAGMWDFYRWEYDYGHNLNPHAPIQMPGMSYQPPLLGSKTLLNITAISLPDVAGIALGAVAVIALLPIIRPLLRRGRLKRLAHDLAALISVLTAVVAGGCRPGMSEIRLGRDACDHCRMTIVDGRFGGEVVLAKGKVLKFDSIDCLRSFAQGNLASIRELYVEDFFEPGHLVNVKAASFARSGMSRGPMGSGWIATAASGRLSEALRWQDVISGS